MYLPRARYNGLAQHAWVAMTNRRLSDTELANLSDPLVRDVRAKLRELAGEDEGLLWALRRKLAKELTYDERGKPARRRLLKEKKRKAQGGKCADCGEVLPTKNCVLDRIEAMAGYTPENTRLLCPDCDVKIQAGRSYS